MAGVVPRKVRPSSPKVMVANTGSVVLSTAASTAALASSRSAMVSTTMRSQPAASAAQACSEKMSKASSKVRVPKGSSKRAGRPDVAGHQRRSGRPRVGRSRRVHLGHGSAGVRELQAVGVERVGGDAVGASFHVLTLDGYDGLGVREVQQIRHRVDGMETGRLDESAHAAIEQQVGAAGQGLGQMGIGHGELTRGCHSKSFLERAGRTYRQRGKWSSALLPGRNLDRGHRPMTAVMDLAGTRRWAAVAQIPRARSAPLATRKAGWQLSGRSP